MRGNFFSAGALSRPDARPAGGKFSPPARRGSAPAEKSQQCAGTRAEQQEQNNKSRTTRAEQQEQNKSRTRAGQEQDNPPPAGLVAPNARAHSRFPHRPPGGSPTLHPITAGLGAPNARAPSRRSPCPRGWSRPMRAPPPAPTAAPKGAPPPFRPNILCRESARQSPPRFLFPRRGGKPPPRGARQNHISSADIIFHWRRNQYRHYALGRARSALPARRSPSPMPALWRARAGRGGGCPSPWGGAALYPVAVLAKLRSAPPPTRWRGLPASRGLPPPPRESGRFPRVARLPFVFHRPQGGRFARGIRVVVFRPLSSRRVAALRCAVSVGAT